MSGRAIFLDEATAIGDRLCRDALWHRGRASWLTARSEPNPNGGPQVKAVNPTIHSGTAGIGLFLARLHARTKDPVHRRTAQGALAHAVKHAFQDKPEGGGAVVSPGGRHRMGFYLGAMGIGWTAIEVSETLGDPQLRRDGERIVRDVFADREKPFEIDLMFGAASSLVAALDLDRRGVPGAREHALAMGEHLLARAHVLEGAWSWGEFPTNPTARNLCGFSHGASGVAWSLAQLHKETRDERMREAAEGALLYERQNVDERERNWSDYLQIPDGHGRHPCRTTWCHGAPGIGLARAQLREGLRSPLVDEDLRLALDTTEARIQAMLGEPGEIFQLCCGLAGLIECRWWMEESLGRPGAAERAREAGAWAIERYGVEAQAQAPGWLDWPTGTPKGSQPYLMQGIAGLGNLFLRLDDPRTPTVLMPARTATA